MTAAKKILEDALTLPTDTRAEVAAALLASLDHDQPAEAARNAAWATEIERRAERVLSGKAQGRPWKEVRRRLIERLERD